jgi:hypothetical protein
MSTKFENLAENPLDGLMVSVSRRIGYADINIERMTKNNPGNVLAQLITDTKAKRDAFAGNLSASKMGEAIRMAYTSELDTIVEQFRATVSKFEGLVKSVFGKGTPTYIMFFPFGLVEFHQANQAEILPLMDKIISLSLTHQTALGNPAYRTSFMDYKTRYANAYSLQKQAAGTVTNSKAVKEVLWNELKKQLYKNMLTLVLNNLDNPTVMLTYFEQSLLRYKQTKSATENTDNSTEGTYTATIAPDTTFTADIKFAATDTLLIINNGSIPVYYFGAATSTQAAPANPAELAEGDEIEIAATELGAPANTFLRFLNTDKTETAEIEIALL